MESPSMKAQALGDGPILVVLTRADATGAMLRAARYLAQALDRRLVLGVVAEQPMTEAAALSHMGLPRDMAVEAAVYVVVGEPARAIVGLGENLACAVIALAIPAPLSSGEEAIFRQVLTSAHCPVLAVPGVLNPRWGEQHRLLVPLDGTPGTAAAVPLAGDVARALGAQLAFTHVAGIPAAEPGAMSVPAFMDQPQHDWPAWRREFLGRFAQPGLGETRLTVEAGPPGAGILQAAERQGVDLLVVGWHGCLSGGHAATLRSVLAATRWPVLATRLYPAPDRKPG